MAKADLDKDYMRFDDATNKIEKPLYYEVKTGTTIVAAVYDGGVMLAADGRSTSGVYVANRASDKIHDITKNIFCCVCGTSSHSQFLTTQARNYMLQFEVEYGDKPPVKVAARLLQQFLYNYKEYLSSALIVGGYDNLEGSAIYEVGMGGSVIKRNFALNGSGSRYIYGFCDTFFKEKMTKQECKEFLSKAVTLAMYRDCSSGGVIRIVDITKDGFTRDYIEYNKINLPKTD